MSFLYPRLVGIKRAPNQTGEGAIGYGGHIQSNEALVAADVPANIELRREGQRNAVALPGDGTRPTYDVRIPKASLAKGMIMDRDIVVDDLGLRYLVVGPYWNSLGHALRVELLAA